MADVNIEADGTLVKGFFIILLGAALAAVLKYAWTLTLGRMLDQATAGRI